MNFFNLSFFRACIYIFGLLFGIAGLGGAGPGGPGEAGGEASGLCAGLGEELQGFESQRERF